jgi:hypothetical protein
MIMSEEMRLEIIKAAARGSNTLTVDTTVQPSEMTITYKGGCKCGKRT